MLFVFTFWNYLNTEIILKYFIHRISDLAKMWKFTLLLLFGLFIKVESLRFEDTSSSEEYQESAEDLQPQQPSSKIASMTW